MHSREFAPLPNYGLAASFNHSRSNEVPLLAKGAILHSVGVKLQVGDLALGGLAPRARLRQAGRGLGDDVLDSIPEEAPFLLR